MVVLKIQDSNLKIKEDDSTILEKINLEVKSGEIVLLSGVNGAGKSTLLKSLMAYSVCDEVEYANLIGTLEEAEEIEETEEKGRRL